MKNIRIAIVVAHFMPEVEYMEVKIAQALAEFGHNVKVFTSTLKSPSVGAIISHDYKEGEEVIDDYIICRIKPILSFKTNVLSYSLKRQVFDFSPELVLVIGVAKIFPNIVYNLKNILNAQFLTFFGENPDQLKFKGVKGRLKSYFTRRIFKRYFYDRAINKSDKLVLYTPATYKTLNLFVGASAYKKISDKTISSYLGFDSSVFYFDEKERDTLRAKYQIKDNSIVFVTATRLKSYKNIERIISYIDGLNRKFDVYYFIIGSMNDKYSFEMRDYINTMTYSDKIFLLDFQPSDSIRKYYNAADFGIWTQAAISIQQAMGTGLKVLVPDTDVVRFLAENDRGVCYKRSDINDIIDNQVQRFDFNLSKRAERASEFSLLYSWANIMKTLIPEIK